MLTAWVLSGILVIFIPVIYWNRKKSKFFKEYGYIIEYENYRKFSYYPSCSWYQWRCRRKQFQYLDGMEEKSSGEDSEDGDYGINDLPTWYRFLGGLTEDERHVKEELNVDSTSGALKFVYGCTLVMFISMLAYGAYVLCTRRRAGRIVLIMALFAQFSLLNLLLLVQGVILTDDQDLQNEIYGWYGQLSVLMAYTDFMYILFCTVFALVFVVRDCWRGENYGAYNIKNKINNSDDFVAVISPKRQAKDPHAWKIRGPNEAKCTEPSIEVNKYMSARELNIV
jgi:hypothetical protein